MLDISFSLKDAFLSSRNWIQNQIRIHTEFEFRPKCLWKIKYSNLDILHTFVLRRHTFFFVAVLKVTDATAWTGTLSTLTASTNKHFHGLYKPRLVLSWTPEVFSWPSQAPKKHNLAFRSTNNYSTGSVADPDPGSGAFLTPGSRIGLFRILDLGSRIPNSYFWELSDNFLGKKFHNALKLGQIFFLSSSNIN